MIAPRGFVHQEQLGDPLHPEAALRVRADLNPPVSEQRQQRRPALRWTVIGTVMTHEYPWIPVDEQRRKPAESRPPRTPVDGRAQASNLGVGGSNPSRRATIPRPIVSRRAYVDPRHPPHIQ